MAARVTTSDAVGVRNTYADLLRAVAIVAVVLGHWLATGIVYRAGHLEGVDVLGVLPWTSWLTLLLQVVPVFFLVGGYANAVSWSTRHADGDSWQEWVRRRVLRLLAPTSGYLLAVAVVVACCQFAGVDARSLGQAAWAVALHLWFLAAYLLVLLFTPALYAAHRRWGLRVPLAMAALAVVIDIGVIDFRWHVVGWANYFLVWGTFHQLGFSWHDGTLTARRRPMELAAASAVVLVALIWWGPYPVSMVGVPGARIQNASPPSAALLAFGLAQTGVVLAAEPIVSRLIARHRRARSMIERAGALTMPVYLWHMVPIVLLVVAGYPPRTGQPAIGTGAWWVQRIGWVAALTIVLAALLAVLAGLSSAGRRGRRPVATRRSAASRPGGAVLLVIGVVAAAVGIGVLAVKGFAPGDRLDLTPLGEVAVGLALVRASALGSLHRGVNQPVDDREIDLGGPNPQRQLPGDARRPHHVAGKR